MVNETATLSLGALIRKLSSIPVDPERSILSLYLQSHGHDLEQRKRVRIFLDHTLRSKEISELQARSREWKNKIQTIAKQADSFLNDKDKGCFHGIAFFASEEEADVLSYASYLPLPNNSYVLGLPALGPLVALRDDYEPLCICSFKQEEAQIFQLMEGFLIDQRKLETEIWSHHKQGGWSQARFQRKHDVDVEHFLKEVGHELEKIAIRHSDMKFVLLGQRRELPMLRKSLPDQVARRLIGEDVVDGVSPNQLIRRGLDSLRRYEELQEHDDVAKLSLGRISQGYGSVNREKVFRAINEGQVDTLILNPNLSESGAVVLSTHTILDKFKQESPYDGDPVTIAPLREILVYETVRHNGRIQWLSGAVNGQAPDFGVLYRSRGGAEYAGN